MAVKSAKMTESTSLKQYLPFLAWLPKYRREDLTGDVIAGVIVAVMLVPQGMAYALLAGMPPETGLYASIVPLIIYGLLGTSRVLAVGPTAMVSLLIAAGIGSLNPASTAEYMQYALIMALQVAIIQMLMGLLHVGFLVNFLSHPVLSGFTSAAAIIIGVGQVKHVLGYDVPRFEHFYEQVGFLFTNITHTNLTTLIIGLCAIGVLLAFKYPLATWMKAHLPEFIAVPLSKLGPLVVVVAGVIVVARFGLAQAAGVGIVGDVPGGLPQVAAPPFNFAMWQAVFPTAIAISLVGYMESISVAKALASKKRQKIDPDQELIALGAANIGAAFTGAFPVTGGLSRTVVNDTAGARTGMASIFTAILVALTVMFLTPLFFYLPSAVLAAIIIVAVAKLFDWHAFIHAWRYNRADGLSLLVTFGAVLAAGIEAGILIGAAVSMGLYLYRTSKPHTAVIGRIPGTEHFRNVKRHDVETCSEVLLFRVDESLYFPNVTYLELQLLELVADNPEIEHVVLVCSAVNYIDVSALEVLERLMSELRSSGVTFYMAEVKGPVMDRLRQVGFIDHLGGDRVFLSTQRAYEYLKAATG